MSEDEWLTEGSTCIMCYQREMKHYIKYSSLPDLAIILSDI